MEGAEAMTAHFPDTFDFAGCNAPMRVECDIYDLIVEGNVPTEIHGAWYRTIPDPQYPPMLGHDTYLSGDGMISSFQFENGHVDFKMRYVMTERLKAERKARRGLFGLYRNPFTDDSSVQGINRCVNNTTPVFHGGRLLALKEDGLAMEVHPETLETLGVWNFRGKLKSRTMTAHTRLDPENDELHFFGYEAAGLATRDVSYCVANREGHLVKEDWFKVPYVSMMHDFAVTKQHVIFPVFPTTADLERIRTGGPHWIWEPTRDTYVGIMPRDGSVEDMHWFRRPACSAYHFMNAYTEGKYVHLDFGVGKVNPFPFIQEASHIHPTAADMAGGGVVRWSFDMSKPGEKFEEYPLAPAGDFPRIAMKDHMLDYGVGYYERFDPQVGPPLMAGPVGAGFNTVCRLEVKSGKTKSWHPQQPATIQEEVHIPSKMPSHEGYLALVVDRHDDKLSDMVILEAARPDQGPIATIKMPLRLRNQVHGNWVSAEELQ
jgi:carotenoid cleavage dioxygenase-like enzyme